MIDFAAYLGGNNALPEGTEAVRATLAWNRILHNGELISFDDQVGNALPEQRVRIELDTRASLVVNEISGRAPSRGCIIFGVRNHPDPNVEDTIIGEGYTFAYGKDFYKVTDVNASQLGEIQANAESNG